jgi:hypothetical protein
MVFATDPCIKPAACARRCSLWSGALDLTRGSAAQGAMRATGVSGQAPSGWRSPGRTRRRRWLQPSSMTRTVLCTPGEAQTTTLAIEDGRGYRGQRPGLLVLCHVLVACHVHGPESGVSRDAGPGRDGRPARPGPDARETAESGPRPRLTPRTPTHPAVIINLLGCPTWKVDDHGTDRRAGPSPHLPRPRRREWAAGDSQRCNTPGPRDKRRRSGIQPAIAGVSRMQTWRTTRIGA